MADARPALLWTLGIDAEMLGLPFMTNERLSARRAVAGELPLG
ncbi:unannotated protein [freshwater metagenome]|uniref:Unannotated protein n=1 Tax=freshwater metagenome TaxID=449393 RepID=A0A6J6D5M7_9ZZZZ